MNTLIASRQTKPNRIETPEAAKGKDYHIEYGRWVLGSGNSVKHRMRIDKTHINLEFYKNNQWNDPEDAEAFFQDETGQDRHRIRVTKNYIQPMVEQYRGNADKMRFDMKVFNISPLSRSRRDKALARLKTYQYGAEVNPGFKEYLNTNGIPVGKNQQETEDKFDNVYTDEFVVAGNKLLRSVAELNDLDGYKSKLALDIACGGIGVMKPYPHGGDWMFTRVSPDQWGFDTSAQSETLKDSEFFWEWDLMSPTTIYEQYPFQIGDMARSTIEAYVANATAKSLVSNKFYDVHGKVPVYTAKWRDLLVDKFGYVMDQYGQRILTRIGYIAPEEEEPQYTMKDVIPIKQLTGHQKKVLRGKSTAYLYVDNWRFAIFIPQEVVSVQTDNKNKDLLLDYGVMPYQEADLYRPTNMYPPYKVGIWSYVDGEVLSPVDVTINPQRMINRFMSVMENRLNTAGGSGTLYDKDMIGPDQEDEFQAKIMRGEPLGVSGRGRGVQNLVGKYDGMPYQTIVAFSNLIENMKLGIEDSTGVNEGLKGNTNNPDQLVGVMQLMIQRGSIIQEPFYKALTDIYKGCYQSILTSGKRYYIDNDLDLDDYVGVDGAQVIRLSKDMRLESLRAVVTRAIDPQTERMYVDQEILKWLQFGLIDQPTVASLTGKASFEEAVIAMRDFQRDLIARQRMANQQQQVMDANVANANEQMGRITMEEQIRQETREDLNKEGDRQVKRDVAATKQAPQQAP